MTDTTKCYPSTDNSMLYLVSFLTPCLALKADKLNQLFNAIRQTWRQKWGKNYDRHCSVHIFQIFRKNYSEKY